MYTMYMLHAYIDRYIYCVLYLMYNMNTCTYMCDLIVTYMYMYIDR